MNQTKPSHRRSHLATILSVLSVLLFAIPSVAAVVELANVEVTGHQLNIDPLIPFDTVRVSVVGPGGYEMTRTFTRDDIASLDLPQIDGLYKYELRFGPELDDETKAALAQSRRDGSAPPDLGDAVFGDMVAFGAFSIAQGTLVQTLEEVPVSEKGGLDKVVLTNADGVIRNSLCVGFDCPDSPAFGDSTVLMMENNTRIKFGDTSASPFPANDWEIEANSASSGGANYLGFNDCGSADNDGGCATDLVFAVEAGARQSALYVESDGDVGFGTANPVVNLHIVDGNSPTLRLDQDTSSGFAAQAWDVAGNETSFFIRNVTGGSTLPFRIFPGAGSNALVIDASGEVGINAGTNPATDLHIRDTTSNAEVQLDTASQSWKWRANSANNQMNVIDNTNSKTPFRIGANSDNNLFQIGVSAVNQVDVNGNLNITGTCTGCDAVFSTEWPLESIEEHAEAMWRNSYLPAVGPTNEGQTSIDVFEKITGILQELEKAHIYIEQLHSQVQKQQETIEALTVHLGGVDAAE